MVAFSHLLNTNYPKVSLEKQRTKSISCSQSSQREHKLYGGVMSEAIEIYTRVKALELAEERSDDSYEDIKEYASLGPGDT